MGGAWVSPGRGGTRFSSEEVGSKCNVKKWHYIFVALRGIVCVYSDARHAGPSFSGMESGFRVTQVGRL